MMDSDTLQTAGRLTAAMIPHLALDEDGDIAAGQVASMYWTIVRQMVDLRKSPEDVRVSLPSMKQP